MIRTYENNLELLNYKNCIPISLIITDVNTCSKRKYFVKGMSEVGEEDDSSLSLSVTICTMVE